MQLSPARGRLQTSDENQYKQTRCSLAPRGDGYSQWTQAILSVVGYSLAPRGDGYRMLSMVFMMILDAA